MLPLLKRARSRLADELEDALTIVAGKTNQAAEELRRSPGLGR